MTVTDGRMEEVRESDTKIRRGLLRWKRKKCQGLQRQRGQGRQGQKRFTRLVNCEDTGGIHRELSAAARLTFQETWLS